QSRTSARQTTGYVILDSKVTSGIDHAASPAAKSTIGLGRPWRPFSRVVFIRTELPAEITPAGWNNWNNPTNETTAYYAESGNTGPGAVTTERVKWSHQLTPPETTPFLPANFLRGNDHWNPQAEASHLP
ncbi:MAG: pectinesterase family protein, partial [Granulicella sp.]